MVIAPAALHIAALSLSTLFAFMTRIPTKYRDVVWTLSCPKRATSFAFWALITFRWTASLILFFTVAFPLLQYASLPAPVKSSVLRAIFYGTDRPYLRTVYWATYRRWQWIQAKHFASLGSDVFGICMKGVIYSWELWAALSWPQKLLVIAPVAIFYACIDIIPVLRRYWRRSWNRGRWRQE
ncbi:hypothetical protein C8R46DRAFT_1096639 [Mycena filopes]|nr:hypothetical protein C8R46DRAFT_1096639 [Mycena filopes]